MSLALYSHPDMLEHRPGPSHVESPERLGAVLDALRDSDLDLDRREAAEIGRDALEAVHGAVLVGAMYDAAPSSGLVRIDADTALSPGSLRAARLAAGAVVEAVKAVARGEIERAFAAVRPPGHHAEPGRPMGFCLFSNIGLGVRAAQAAGLRRVAVVDFDVHHGNGTQALAEADPDLFFASIHEFPNYPGTGGDDEVGLGNVVNATVPPGASAQLWRRRFADRLMPAVDAFAPDIVLVSAGFDAHARDPLARQDLEAGDFAWATRAILEVARARSKGRVVSSLEGGYDLEALGRSALAHVGALAGG